MDITFTSYFEKVLSRNRSISKRTLVTPISAFITHTVIFVDFKIHPKSLPVFPKNRKYRRIDIRPQLKLKKNFILSSPHPTYPLKPYFTKAIFNAHKTTCLNILYPKLLIHFLCIPICVITLLCQVQNQFEYQKLT
ncbi:hypothetical protein JGI10_01289, partial [Candidatus Kryptonium thompsonii]